MNQKVEYFFTSGSWKYLKIAVGIGLMAYGIALCFEHKVSGVGLAAFGFSILVHRDLKPQIKIPFFALGIILVVLAYFYLLRGYDMDGVLIEDLIKEYQNASNQ